MRLNIITVNVVDFRINAEYETRVQSLVANAVKLGVNTTVKIILNTEGGWRSEFRHYDQI